MAINTLITRGFGNGTYAGTIALLVTRGFAIGAAALPATTSYLLEGVMAANSILLEATMGGDVLLEGDMTANSVLLEGNLT